MAGFLVKSFWGVVGEKKITHYTRCLDLELLCNSLCGPLPKNLNSTDLQNINCTDSQRSVNEGVTAENSRMNRLLFADELVGLLHVWTFSTGSSARI